jgi:flagellin-like protein
MTIQAAVHYNRKAISPVIGTLVALVVVVVIAIIFYTFIRGGFSQERWLFESAQEKTGEIPCFREPKLEAPDVYFVNVSNDLISGETKQLAANFTVNLSSSCFEDLWVTWKVGNTVTQTLCVYSGGKYVSNETHTELNCIFFNKTYSLSRANLLNYLSDDVTVSAFGVKSGKYVELTRNIFVPDPNFKITNVEADTSDFPCVKLKFDYNSSLGPDELSNRLSGTKPLSVEDKGMKLVEDYDNNSLVNKINVPLVYRAPRIPGHRATLYFTIGAQTVTSDTSFTVDDYSSRHGLDEIFVASHKDDGSSDVKVFGWNGTDFVEIVPTNIYQLISGVVDALNKKGIKYLQDIAVSDLDNDGIAEVALLFSGYASYGDIIVFKYTKSEVEALTSIIESCPQDGFATCLEENWPWYKDIDNLDWKEVQTDGSDIYILASYVGANPYGDLWKFTYTSRGLIGPKNYTDPEAKGRAKDIPDHNYTDFVVKDGIVYLLDNDVANDNTGSWKKSYKFNFEDLPDKVEDWKNQPLICENCEVSSDGGDWLGIAAGNFMTNDGKSYNLALMWKYKNKYFTRYVTYDSDTSDSKNVGESIKDLEGGNFEKGAYYPGDELLYVTDGNSIRYINPYTNLGRSTNLNVDVAGIGAYDAACML